MTLKNKLNNTVSHTKSITTALFVSAMTQAMGNIPPPPPDEDYLNNSATQETLNNISDIKKDGHTPSPYKFNAKLSYGLETEAKNSKKSIQDFALNASPSFGVNNDKTRIDFNSLFYLSNHTIDESFDFFTSRVMVECGHKFGMGELVFSIGKMRHLDDVGSVNFGGTSVAMNNWLIDKNCFLSTDNTLKIGWKTPKSLIELGYVGTTNDHSLTFFDFNRMKNGQVVLVGAYKPIEELKFKIAALTDEKKLNHLGITSTYSKNGTIASIDFIYKLDNNQKRNLISVFTVNQELSESLNVFIQGAIDKVKGEKTGYKTLLGLEHNSGAYIYTGMERESGTKQNAAVLGIGFKFYGDKKLR